MINKNDKIHIIILEKQLLEMQIAINILTADKDFYKQSYHSLVVHTWYERLINKILNYFKQHKNKVKIYRNTLWS